jgi:hypothetical protein
VCSKEGEIAIIKRSKAVNYFITREFIFLISNVFLLNFSANVNKILKLKIVNLHKII